MRCVLRVQDEIPSALRDFLRSNGFVEILAPIIWPVADPRIRVVRHASVDFYSHSFKIMSSMILYKQMTVSSLERVFALSPNIRQEPSESIETGRHLSGFRQLDLEVADAYYFDVMGIGERLVRYTCHRIREACREELLHLGRDLKLPSVPFRNMTHEEAVELFRSEGYKVNKGDEIPWAAKEAISRMFEEPFWIYDYPMTARGFYDREDLERPGLLRDFDLIYSEGFGEAISGGKGNTSLRR